MNSRLSVLCILGVEEAGKGPGDYQLPTITSEFITATIPAKNAQRFHLNADGRGADAALKIELLGADEKPLPGYSATIRQSGFQTPIVWSGGAGLPERIRVHVTFEGARHTDIRFSAIYLRSEP